MAGYDFAAILQNLAPLFQGDAYDAALARAPRQARQEEALNQIGGSGVDTEPEILQGGSAEPPAPQTLAPSPEGRSLQQALEAIPEPTATPLDNGLNNGPMPTNRLYGSPIEGTGPRIFNRQEGGGYAEDTNPYARNADGSVMTPADWDRMTANSDPGTDGLPAMMGPHGQFNFANNQRNRQLRQQMAQLTSGLPVSQTERLYAQQLEAAMGDINKLMHSGAITPEVALQAMRHAHHDYGPIAARIKQEEEQQKQVQIARTMDQLGFHNAAQAQMERALRQDRAGSHQETIRAVPTPNGPVLWTVDSKGDLQVIEPPRAGQQSDQAGAADVMLRGRTENEIRRDEHRLVQHRLESAEDTRQYNHLLQELDRRHNQYIQRRRDGSTEEVPAELRSEEARQAWIESHLNRIRPGWSRRAADLDARSQGGQPQQGGPPAPQGPPAGSPAAQGPAGPQQTAGQGAPAQQGQQRPSSAQALAHLEWTRAARDAATLAKPEDRAHADFLIGQIRQFQVRYSRTAPDKVPEEAQHRYTTLQRMLNEIMKREKAPTPTGPNVDALMSGAT